MVKNPFKIFYKKKVATFAKSNTPLKKVGIVKTKKHYGKKLSNRRVTCKSKDN